MMTITRITQYCKDDPEFFGDYTAITLKLGRKVIASFGDGYHDRGYEKSEGFLMGLRYTHEVEVIEKRVATYEC